MKTLLIAFALIAFAACPAFAQHGGKGTFSKAPTFKAPSGVHKGATSFKAPTKAPQFKAPQGVHKGAISFKPAQGAKAPAGGFKFSPPKGFHTGKK